MLPFLHNQLLLIILNCMCDPRFVHPKNRVSCCWSMQKVSFRTKHSYEGRDVWSTIKVGSTWIEGTLVGLLEVRWSTFSGGIKQLMKPQNIVHDAKGLILCQSLIVNKLEGSGGMLCWEILKLRLFEVARSMYLSIYFHIFKIFKKGNQVTWKGAYCLNFWKLGACTPFAPSSCVHVWKQKVIVTSIAVATTKFLFGMCDCMVDSDAGFSNFSLMLGIWHVYGHKCLLA